MCAPLPALASSIALLPVGAQGLGLPGDSRYPIFTFEHFKRMISITEPEQKEELDKREL